MEKAINETISTQQITDQLNRILSDRLFLSSSILSSFLKFVVDETLAGRQRELKEYVIALKVLFKKSDFNPQLDPVVRIHAGRLRRTLTEYYHEGGKNDPVLISIPKGSYTAQFALKPKSVSGPRDEKLSIHEKPAIAVLPFRNINPETPNVFFEDGLADHISTELTQFPELTVVSYYSCRHIVSKVNDIREVALLLNTQYILTGTVQSDSESLRVRVQLIRGETNEQLWANSYERVGSVSKLFALQDEIVSEVVSAITGHYGVIFRSLTRIPPQKNIEDLNIYNAIFWYYHFVNNTTKEIFLKAEAAMQKAIKMDPDYALGWAVLGEVYIGGYFMGFKSEDVENLATEALKCGRKSIKIDPLCQHAYQTMALGYLFLNDRLACLEVISNWKKLKQKAAGIMGGIGFCLICCGGYEEGFRMLSDSIKLNPYYQWWFNGGASFYYFHKKDYELSILWAKKMNMSHIPWELIMSAASYTELNKMEEANRCMTEIEERFPFLRGVMKNYLGAFIQDRQLVANLFDNLSKAGRYED